MKSFILLLFLSILILSVSAQNKPKRYFHNPIVDNKSTKVIFNGVSYSYIFADDFTLNGWSEFKMKWYQKNNKMIGFHPIVSLGSFYDLVSCDEPLCDNPLSLSHGFFIESGFSIAYHYFFLNIKFNNCLKKYFEFKTSETFKFHDELVYVASIEDGFYFDRFDLNAELGLGWNLSSYMEFYSVYASINLGILLGSMKYK